LSGFGNSLNTRPRAKRAASDYRQYAILRIAKSLSDRVSFAAMASFTTRIELHDATENDYDKLHKAMEKVGFVRTIKDSEGKTYHLPTAEYNRILDGLTAEEVLSDAKTAASSTKRKYRILVTESKRRMWKLDEVLRTYLPKR
jgi:hypothetical protein